MDVSELESSLKGKLGTDIKYMGIFMSDQIPSVSYNTKPVVLIANTLKTKSDINIVGHWVVLYFEFYPMKRILFFDSYGLSPYFYIDSGFSQVLKKKYKDTRVYHFGEQFQPNQSMKCGLYVCMFIHYISKYGLTKFTKDIYSKLKYKNKKDLPYNDRFLTHYYFKYLVKSPCSHWKFGSKRAITYKECLSYKKGVCFLFCFLMTYSQCIYLFLFL